MAIGSGRYQTIRSAKKLTIKETRSSYEMRAERPRGKDGLEGSYVTRPTGGSGQEQSQREERESIESGRKNQEVKAVRGSAVRSGEHSRGAC
eukprot:160139-Pleurochrysis_carterae.AAC.3